MPCIVNGSEIILSGDVGSTGDWWFGEEPGFTSSDVIMALAQVGADNDVTIRINSGGGIAWEGSAIHAAIARHKGKVTMIVEGVAASAASIITMAGDDVSMSLGAILMVHEASGVTIGDARTHQLAIDCLDTLNDAMASIYAAKTSRPVADCRADMAAETWMTADQAKTLGYADRVEGVPDTTDAEGAPTAPVEPAPFAYRAYRHAPEPILALADRKNWPRRLPQAAAPVPPTAQEKSMSKPKAEQTAPVEPEAKPAPAPATTGDPSPETKDATVDPKTELVFQRADAAEIADICNAGDAPTMIGSLIREGVSAEQARQRVNAAGQIKDVVALARKNAPHLADDIAAKAIAAGKSVGTVKAELFDAMAAASEKYPIDHHHRAGTGGANHSATTPADGRAKSKANMQAELKRRGMRPKED